MDGQVGTVLNMLEDQQVSSNTLFIYLSEQGSSFPLSKWTCYEDGVRSAMIARWPRGDQRGHRLLTRLWNTTTFCQRSSPRPAAGRQTNWTAVSLLPVFRGPDAPGQTVCVQHPDNTRNHSRKRILRRPGRDRWTLPLHLQHLTRDAVPKRLHAYQEQEPLVGKLETQGKD